MPIRTAISRKRKWTDRLSEATPEDRIAYSQMHKAFELIASMNAEEVEGGDKNESKTNSKINKFKIDVRE